MLKSEYIIWKTETMEQIRKDHPDWTEEQVQKFFKKVESSLRKRGFFDIAEEQEKIELGQTVMTRGIAIKTSADWTFKKFVGDSLHKFMRKDFGDISEEDKQTNEDALENGGMVMGAYSQWETKIWIMRDPDGNGSFVTTVLFPNEY